MSWGLAFFLIIFLGGFGWEIFLFLYSLFSFLICLHFIGDFLRSFFIIDYLSVGLIFLSFWVGLIILLASVRFDFSKNIFREFILLVGLLVILLFYRFSFRNLFLFYIRFEFTIVPTFFLILGWGYRVERFQAGLYMFIYTLAASLPFLVILFFLNTLEGSLNYIYLFFYREKFLGGIWWFYISIVFLVKLPVFLVHLWLPKAHVEAPLAGSIILAGVLLKLGGYGMIRSFNFCSYDFIKIRGFLSSLGLLGGVLISFVCMRQVDLKCLVAYSSVAHIGSVLCGLLCFLWIGTIGRYIMILAHGICSSGLFCLLNLMYERWGSRRVLLIKGGIICLPVLSFWWFTLCVGNISCPPSFNFISEIFIVLGIMRWRYLMIFGLVILLVIRGVYTVYFFVSFNHGSLVNGMNLWSLRVRENLLLISHVFPMFFILLIVNLLICSFSLKKMLNCGFRDVFLWTIIFKWWGGFYIILHVLFLLIFIKVCSGIGYILEFPLSSIGGVDFSFILIFDWISLGFVNFVCLIAGAVIFYRNVYIHGDVREKRFIVLVNLFVASIAILIFRPNILSLMLGWDGLGLVSFLLVIYYYNISSLKSGLITIYTNRLGDAAIIFALFYFYEGGNWNSSSVLISFNWRWMGLFVILAGMTKRAQLPFSAWLPAAMAAPTPVSSLVHSSTLVTAGVYLILRFYYIVHNFFFRKIFSFIFIITTLLAGIIACFEIDLKKIVAMSTLRQLGLILFILSIGDWLFCYYHIVCHALFKALLFLSCGMIISLSFGNQDIRFIGAISFISPGIRVLLGISSLSLLGFPFFAGFYSKDLILEISIFYEEYLFYLFLLVFCCVLTVVYSYRLFKVGLSSCRIGFSIVKVGENIEILGGMVILGFWSIFLGRILGYILLGNGVPMMIFQEKLIGVLIVMVGLFFAFIEVWNFVKRRLFKEFFGEMGFLNWISRGYFSARLYILIYGVKGDYLWGEMLGPKGIFLFLEKRSSIEIAKGIFSLKTSLLLGIVWRLLFLCFYLLFSLYRVQFWSNWGF